MANNTTTTKANSNVITISTLGTFCKDYKAGTKALTCTAKSMTEYGIENAQNFIDFAQRFYVAIGAMMDLRQAQGIKVDEGLLAAAEAEVKKLSDSWFKMVGTRPAQGKAKELRPCYGTRYADFAIYGEILGQAMTEANGDLAKITPKFFELLVLNTARIFSGEKLGRITDVEFKKAKKAANAAKAEKAKETKSKNATKAGNDIDKAAEVTAKIEELEINLSEQVANIEKAIALVMASHATDDEKAAIVAMLAVANTSDVPAEQVAA